MTTPIPSPPGLPLLGNVFDIDPQNQLASLKHLAEVYGKPHFLTQPSHVKKHNLKTTISGPIYELRLPSGNVIVVSNHELFDEICDEKRFGKKLNGPLTQLRSAVHDGLFTAHNGEHAWEVAHRILVPSFGPLAIRDMFDGRCKCGIHLTGNRSAD